MVKSVNTLLEYNQLNELLKIIIHMKV